MHSFPGRAESLSAKLQGQFLPRKKRGFSGESKKFIYCFPILLLSVSAGQRAGQRPLHLQHSYWLSQTNLSDSLIVPHKHESLIATNIHLV